MSRPLTAAAGSSADWARVMPEAWKKGVENRPARSVPLLWAYTPLLAFTVAHYLVSLRVNGFTRDFDIAQADWRFALWPDSSKTVRIIEPHVNSRGRYLGSTPEAPLYSFREKTTHRQWQSVFGMEYTDGKGEYSAGDAAYRAALRDGAFDLIVLDGLTDPRVDDVIAGAVRGNPHYRLLANLPFRNSAGTGEYRIRVKTS
ncbi:MULTISPECIES: hypothetical protein [Streptomyces]|uniref:hypothetical protein n=1 Tax=Streptomyces TaxID=1883 RepID=UPI001F491F70|nr:MULTISPECIES: hypothetical protein [Streptomyces]